MALASSVINAVRRLPAWQFFFFLLIASSASASAIKCTNTASTDPQLVQAAVNSGGTVTLSGNCNFSSGGITINNAVTLNGSGKPMITGAVTLVTVSSNNVTINGIIFNQGGIYVDGFPTANFTFTNNTIENVSSQAFQFGVLHCEGLLNSNISYNTFYNIWFGGAWPAFPPGFGPGSTPSTIDNMGPAGLEVYNSATNTVFSHNLFNIVGNDALNLHNNGNNGTGPGGTVTITDNEFEHVFRANVEMQQGITNSVISGNYIHDATAPFWNSWGFSLASSGSNITFINNTATTNNPGGVCLPAALEAAGSPYMVQGNVFSTVYPLLGCNGGTWTGVAIGFPANKSDINTFQNNVLCGSPEIVQINQEQSSIGYGAEILDQYNYKNTTGCPAGSKLTGSGIASVFTSPDDQYFPTGGTGTWDVAVVSNLSIRTVQFFVDSSASPVITQSLQDVNTNFATDLKWLYHATINTSTLGGGSHTMTAEVTDVSGAVQKVSQPFTVGYVGTPIAQVSPTSLSFGSAPQGSKTAAEVVTLKNLGTASLVVNSISIKGANPGDFNLTSSCGSSLAGGSSCTMSITFTPLAVGARSASLSISDDASGSPQSVALTGTGTTASTGSALNFSMSLNSWFWDAGQYYWSNNTHLLLYPTYTPNPNQDFQFTSVAGVANGWTICIMGSSVCLTDSGSAGSGGFVTLGAKADTWVATASGTLQNLRTQNFLAYPTGTVGSGTALVTGTAQSAWVFGPTH